MTGSHRNYYILYFINSQTLATSRVEFCDIFFLCWSLVYQESSSNATFFLDPQRGYVTVYWSRIRVLSSPSEGRPLAAVIITTAGSRRLMVSRNSSISYIHTHRLSIRTLWIQVPSSIGGSNSSWNSQFQFQNLSTAVYDVRAFQSSKSYRVPKTLKFQKLSSSKNSQVPKSSRVPKTLEFQKLSSSKNYRVPKILKFQNYRVPKTLKFQKLSSSKNSQVPKAIEFQKLSSFKSYRVPSFRTRVPKYFWVPTNWVPSFRTSVPNYFCVSSTRVPSFRTRVPKYFWVTSFGFHKNSSSTELYRVPSSHNWIARNSGPVFRPSPATPLRSVRICGWLSRSL